MLLAQDVYHQGKNWLTRHRFFGLQFDFGFDLQFTVPAVFVFFLNDLFIKALNVRLQHIFVVQPFCRRNRRAIFHSALAD